MSDDDTWRLSFRPLTRADFPLLASWLAAPHVRRWWNHEFSPEAVERDFGPTVDGREPAEDLIALSGEEPIGVVQRCRFDDHPDYAAALRPHVGDLPPGARTIDYFIGDSVRTGIGLGSAMIAAATDDTFRRYPETTAIIVPVVAANTASWRALEKAGYRRIASGELEPDNPIDDPLHHILRIDR